MGGRLKELKLILHESYPYHIIEKMREESKYESKEGKFSCCCIKSSRFYGHFVSSTIFPVSLAEVSVLRILFRCRHKHSANLHHPLETGKVVNVSRQAPQAARENGKPESQVEPDPCVRRI